MKRKSTTYSARDYSDGFGADGIDVSQKNDDYDLQFTYTRDTKTFGHKFQYDSDTHNRIPLYMEQNFSADASTNFYGIHAHALTLSQTHTRQKTQAINICQTKKALFYTDHNNIYSNFFYYFCDSI